MITTRVPLAEREGVRLILEVDREDPPPLTRAYLRRIDAVRHALACGAICPDDAHAFLLDCSWLGRAAGGGVARGMRALR